MAEQFPLAIWGGIHARFFADAASGSLESVSSNPTDTVLVFVFHDNRFVLANIANRGWTIPGGRIEEHETPESSARREAYEEAGARLGELEKLGFYLLTDTAAEMDSTRKVQVYIARADELVSLPKGFESSGVMRVTLRELPTVYYIWDPLIEAVCTYAHSRALLLGWSL